MTVDEPGANPASLRRAPSRPAPTSRSTPAPTRSPRPGRRLHADYSADCAGTIAVGRDEDLHGHQRRHAAEVDGDQARVNDNGGTAPRRRLHAGRRRDRATDPASSRARGAGHEVTRRCRRVRRDRDRARAATRRATRRLLRHDRDRRDEDLHGHQRRHRAEADVIKHVINDNGGTASLRLHADGRDRAPNPAASRRGAPGTRSPSTPAPTVSPRRGPPANGQPIGRLHGHDRDRPDEDLHDHQQRQAPRS